MILCSVIQSGVAVGVRLAPVLLQMLRLVEAIQELLLENLLNGRGIELLLKLLLLLMLLLLLLQHLKGLQSLQLECLVLLLLSLLLTLSFLLL
jgi:hypothetical protein